MITYKKYPRTVTMSDKHMLMISGQHIVQNSNLSNFAICFSIQRPNHGRR